MADQPFTFTLFTDGDDPTDAEFVWDIDGIVRSLRSESITAWRSDTKMPAPAAGGAWVIDFLVAAGAALSADSIKYLISLLSAWVNKKGWEKRRVFFDLNGERIEVSSERELKDMQSRILLSLSDEDMPSDERDTLFPKKD